ncbi:MAG: hypothetical protein ABEL76_01495 [Bradymonadaceae bacterium]
MEALLPDDAKQLHERVESYLERVADERERFEFLKASAVDGDSKRANAGDTEVYRRGWLAMKLRGSAGQTDRKPRRGR